jgi:hypothetical protein
MLDHEPTFNSNSSSSLLLVECTEQQENDMATKVKSTSSGEGKFPKGGKTKMFGKMGAGPMKSGQTSKAGMGTGGDKFPKGGKTKMFGHMSASPKVPGHTGKVKM